MIEFSSDLTPKVAHNRLLSDADVEKIERWGKTPKNKRVKARVLAESLGCSIKTVWRYSKGRRSALKRYAREVECYVCHKKMIRMTGKKIVLCEKESCRRHNEHALKGYGRRYRILRDTLGFTDDTFDSFVAAALQAKVRRAMRKEIAPVVQSVARPSSDELDEMATRRYG